MTLRTMLLAVGIWAAATPRVLAGELTGIELMGLRVGHGRGAMPSRVDPWLMDLFAMDSQGRFLFLDPGDGPGAIGIYAPNGRFLRRIPLLRPRERLSPPGAYRLWVDGAGSLYVWMADGRLRKFDREGHFVRDIDTQDAGPRYVDRRGHIFGNTLVGVVKEFDADGHLVREVQGLKHPLHLLVDTGGQILFREGPAPSDISIAPDLVPDRGDLFRDRHGNYYFNAAVDGICADFWKYGPDHHTLLARWTHVLLMQRMGYRHGAVEYLRNGGRKPTTTGGRFCTVGWYLSPQDEIYALAGSDSLPRHLPWLRVIRVRVR